MPTYEYVCTSCDTPLEVVQSIHEPSLTDCPSCEDGRLRKVFGNVGVVFKGSGFYRTDSRGKSSATSPATPKTESKKTSESQQFLGLNERSLRNVAEFQFELRIELGLLEVVHPRSVLNH